MTDYRKYINALRKCAKEHDNDRTSMGHIIVSDLCRDTANLLEEVEQEPKVGEWTPLKDRPPEEYDNYMCTMSNGEVQECTFVPKNIKGRIAGWSTCDADGFKWLAEEEVIAWQPLPKPYRGRG